MAFLNSLFLVLCAVTAAGQGITASPLEDHTLHFPPGRRHLLATLPGRPSIVYIGTVGPAETLYIDVEPPTSAGRSTINAFEVIGTPDGGPAQDRPTLQITGIGTPTTGANYRRFTFTAYPRGVAYRFTVRARSQAGLGPFSTPPTAFTTPKQGVPGPPVVTLTRLPDGAYLDITAPVQVRPLTFTLVGHPDGGATAARPRIVITGAGTLVSRQVSAGSSNQKGRRGGSLIAQTTRRFRITGYLPNTVYRFAVSAANSAGAGPESTPRTLFYECKNGYKDTGAGCQCPAIANCKTYSQVNCKCTQCNPGWGNCDSKDNTGCETRLNTTSNCGSCNTKCTLANATPACAAGMCKIARCAAGWGNCDSKDNTGCETRLNTTATCGSCNTKCTLANATPTCAAGMCKIARCAAGWGNCDGTDNTGCETRLNTTSNCGSCNNKCTLSRAAATCDGGSCKVSSCAAGWGNCDGRDSTGCEAALTTIGRCGSCTNRCNLPQAAGACDGGVCKVATCSTGWGNCDGNSTNGCETPLNTTSNCGSCNAKCDLANAAPTCGSGTCAVESCAPGWGNCDGNSTNGCETPLNTTSNCGSCNAKCDLANAAPTCGSGTCAVASCAAGWGNCDGNSTNGCEADFSLPQHCGSCGSVCNTDQLCWSGECVTNALAVAWGAGWSFAGQLGDGIESTSTPVGLFGGLRFKQITSGLEHMCGITPQGQAFCWGDNGYGQLGNVDAVGYSDVPVAVSGNLLFKQISVSDEITCGIDTADIAWCWGGVDFFYSAMLGEGSDTPTKVSDDLRFKQISAGLYHICGIDTAGSAWCWGASFLLGSTVDDDSLVPLPVSSGLQFKQISTGEEHTCGIDTAGHAWCWGDNSDGQLGDGTGGIFSSSDIPVPVAGDLLFKDISAGAYHTCGIQTATGLAFCWGSNTFGALGDATTDNRNTPTRVASDASFQQISAGDFHTCGVQNATGLAFCWGYNSFSQLGDGSDANLDSSKPVGVSGGNLFIQISAGNYHVAALVGS